MRAALVALLTLSACGGQPVALDPGDLDRCGNFLACVEATAPAGCDEATALLDASQRCAAEHPCADGHCGICWLNRQQPCAPLRSALASCPEPEQAAHIGQFNEMCSDIEDDNASNIIPGVGD
jgi:hypothetical protein